MTSLLTIHGLRNQVHPVALPSDSYVINLEEPITNSTRNEPMRNHHHHYITSTLSNDLSSNVHEGANEIIESQNNNNASENNTANNNNVQIGPETRAMLKQLQQYVPFVTILLAKSLYDHRAGIFMFVVLLITFIHANNDLKREIAKQHNRSWSLLMLILCYIIACIMFVGYTFDLHAFAPYAEPLTIWDLLCYVTVMDFFLKLITIMCKVLLTCLPVRLLAFQNRVSILILTRNYVWKLFIQYGQDEIHRSISGQILSYGGSNVSTLSMCRACPTVVVLPVRDVSRSRENRRNFLFSDVYHEQRQRSIITSQTVSHRRMETIPKCGMQKPTFLLFSKLSCYRNVSSSVAMLFLYRA